MPYYAVAKGRSAGVYNSWSDCKSNVDGYSGATYQKFATQSEAQNFVSSRGGNSSSGGSSGGYSGGYSSNSGSSRGNTERVYVDGAARGNGRESVPQSGYGVYYGNNDSRNSAVPLSAVDDVSRVKPTNQRAELHAMNHALRNIEKEQSSNRGSNKSYEIHTDSTYTKNSVDTWANKWKENDWKTSSGSIVANRDLIEEAHNRYSNLREQGVPIDLVHVRGHSGNEGNEHADRLANQGADQM